MLFLLFVVSIFSHPRNNLLAGAADDGLTVSVPGTRKVGGEKRRETATSGATSAASAATVTSPNRRPVPHRHLADLEANPCSACRSHSRSWRPEPSRRTTSGSQPLRGAAEHQVSPPFPPPRLSLVSCPFSAPIQQLRCRRVDRWSPCCWVRVARPHSSASAAAASGGGEGREQGWTSRLEGGGEDKDGRGGRFPVGAKEGQTPPASLCGSLRPLGPIHRPHRRVSPCQACPSFAPGWELAP